MGVAAKQGMIRNLQNTVCHVKQILGRKYDDPVVTEYKRKSTAQVRFETMKTCETDPDIFDTTKC